MGAAALPLFIGSSLLSFNQQRAAGDIAKGESRVQARQAELGATQREADRKGRLAEALASQNASAGARGIAAFEGSPLAILEADIEREEVATERDKFSTDLEVLTTKSRGSIARRQARTSANIGLLKSGSQFKQLSE